MHLLLLPLFLVQLPAAPIGGEGEIDIDAPLTEAHLNDMACPPNTPCHTSDHTLDDQWCQSSVLRLGLHTERDAECIGAPLLVHHHRLV
jgi:hypothetical protein